MLVAVHGGVNRAVPAPVSACQQEPGFPFYIALLFVLGKRLAANLVKQKILLPTLLCCTCLDCFGYVLKP